MARNKEAPAVERALATDLILRRIFEHLTTPELLIASLVCHTWKNQVRFILRNQRACLCRLEALCPCCGTCEDTLKVMSIFNEDVTDLPFNGLFFNIQPGYYHHCSCKLCWSFVSWCEKFLSKFRVKYLKIRWSGDRIHIMVQFLKIVLQKKATELEELIVEDLPTTLSMCDFIGWECSPLPNLRTVVLPKSPNTSFVTALAEVISSAPQLTAIKGWMYSQDIWPIADKLRYVKDFCIRPVHDEESILNIVRENPPKLNSLTIDSKSTGWSSFSECALKTIEFLVLNSLESLTVLRVQLRHFLTIAKMFDKTQFPNVNVIHLEYYDSSSTTILYSIPFSTMFPKLQLVSITNLNEVTSESLDMFADIYPIRRLSYLTSRQPIISTVEMLHVCPGVLQSFPFDALGVFFDVFSNIRFYRATRIQSLPQQLRCLWMLSPRVESITLVVRPLELTSNIDGILCGISNEEVDSLKGMSKEMLGKYQYAATAPALGSLQKLKSFTLEIDHENCWCHYCEDKTNIISSVSVELLIKKLPHVAFRINRRVCDCENFPCNFAFQHLKPYVELVDSD